MVQSLSPASLEPLIRALEELRADALALESEHRRDLDAVRTAAPGYAAGAANLLHYLALRRHDLRDLQRDLASLGLSSLGRCEAHALAGVEAVLAVLRRLAGRTEDAEPTERPPSDFATGPVMLAAHAAELLGPPPPGRSVRVMVTMPSEAATDYGLVRELLAAGMDVCRINCAHDSADEWRAMAAHVRRAAAETGRDCRILADLGGPKLRTGPLAPGPRVVRIRPARDEVGDVAEPVRVLLVPPGRETHETRPGRESASLRPAVVLPLEGEILAAARVGDTLEFTDRRGRPRSWRIAELTAEGGAVAESDRTAYIEAGSPAALSRAGKTVAEGRFGDLSPLTIPLKLWRGDTLVLTADADADAGPAPGRPAGPDGPAQVACTLPAALRGLRPGHRVFLDDGKIGGVVRACDGSRAEVEISHAAAGGSKLGPDKGINLPDSSADIPALTEKDLADLDFVAAECDLVGLSFVHRPEDVRRLHAELAKRRAGRERGGRPRIGVILKIETRTAFERLPRLLLAGLEAPPLGVMVARGDLGVELGFERLAEVQEEILWLCEAAHVPVVWATQVLEGLAKTGLPSRAEVTDAAKGGQAECVMLNKGPYIVETVRFLDDVLRRMGEHREKKRSLLRRLRVSSGL
jgi:pyruvate kinase